MEKVFHPLDHRYRLTSEHRGLRGRLDCGDVEQRLLVDELALMKGPGRRHQSQDDAGQRRVHARVVERQPQSRAERDV